MPMHSEHARAVVQLIVSTQRTGAAGIVVLFCAVLAVALAGCEKAHEGLAGRAREQPDAPWFEDVTLRSGVHFVHDTGPTGRHLVPEQMGSGAALFDYDNDGRLDIFLVQNAGPDSRSVNRSAWAP